MAHTPAQGTLLQLSISSVFTTIAQRVTVKPPGYERPKIDTSDLDSAKRTHIVGIPAGKDVTMRINYDPAAATHTALWNAIHSGSATTPDSWKVIYPDPGAMEVAFSGYVIDWDDAEAEVDGLNAVDITISVTGAITRTP